MSQQSTQAFDALNRIVADLRSKLVLDGIGYVSCRVLEANDLNVGAMNNEREQL